MHRSPPIPEKEIASRTKKAHGRCMHNNSVGAELLANDSWA
jgi:hypothetical protein